MSPADYAPETLRDAWQSCRRAAWPSTFEGCMADALISRIIMLYASHLMDYVREQPQRITDRIFKQPRRFHRASRVEPADEKPRPLDRKRLASGEREDD